MPFIVPCTPAQRMPTLAPGCGYSPDLAPAEQCQAVQQLVSICSDPARPGLAWVLIPRAVRGPRSELILQHRKAL